MMIKLFYKLNYIFLSTLLLVSCVPNNEKLKNNISSPITVNSNSISVSNVAIVNNQLVITGKNFENVKKIQIKGPYLNEFFTIESVTSSRIVAKTIRDASIGINGTIGIQGIFNLIMSDANASTSFDVSFTLQDRSVTADKLSSMGAVTGQILKYNGTTWVPANFSYSQVYLGTYNAALDQIAGSGAPLSSIAANSGDYFIVTTAGSYHGITYPMNSWIMFNGSAWELISIGENVVSSFNSRKGIVVPTAGDYSWSMLTTASGKLTGSKLQDIADIDTTGIASNKVLKWDGVNSKWFMGDDLSGGGAGTVTSTEIADGAIMNVDINASAAIDYSKLNIPDGAIPAAKVAGLPTVTSVTSANADIAIATTTTTPVLTLNSGVGANQIVKLNGSSQLPAVDGSLLTSLSPANISGVVNVAHGGTGTNTLALNGLLFGNTASAVGALATTATPSVLLSTDTTGAPAWTTSTTGNFLKGSVTGVTFGALVMSDLPAGTLSGSGTTSYVPYYSASTTMANSSIAISGTNVGIGTASPSVALDVSGALRAGSSATVTTCGIGQANGEGSQRYNYTSHSMEYCNGTTWVALSSAVPAAGTVGGGCQMGSAWGNATGCGYQQSITCPAGYTPRTFTYCVWYSSCAFNGTNAYPQGICVKD